MRLLIRLRARRDTAYDNTYHHKLRGRVWGALEDSRFDELHDEGQPSGLCFSNPFPPGDMEESDRRTLLVAAPDRDMLGVIADDLNSNPELNIGEMPFDVTDISLLAPDVSEPGTRGVLETGTGVVCRLPPWRCEEYGIETDGKNATFWEPEHTIEPLKAQLENNLDQKHNRFCPDDMPGPSDREGDLFDSYELIKMFAIPVTVTQGVEMTYVLSKWRFGYEVQDDDHRRHLNLALDTGIGGRNALGFGFLNIDEESVVPAGQTETEPAEHGGHTA